MRRSWTVWQQSVVTGTPRQVWERVVSPDGINHEMQPWMTMSLPRGLNAEGLRIDTIPLGTPLGRAWLRLFGVVPFDYDRLTIVEVDDGRQFREESMMLSMRRWSHERTLTQQEPDETVVTDVVSFDPRLSLVPFGWLIHKIVRAFFAHRHRRLRAYFSVTRST